MKQSIALKIFALAVGIIALTVVVAVMTNIEVIGLGRDVASVAHKTIPLAAEAADLNEAGLFRRVAFERLYREYGEPEPDLKTVNEARNNFGKNTERVYQQVGKIRELFEILPIQNVERGGVGRRRPT
jgi:hypothetical protein